MKKLLFLLFLLPLAMFSSCGDDDDVAKVSLNVTFDGLYRSGNDLYAVSTQPFTILSVTCESLNGKAATLGRVNYLWNGFLAGSSIVQPYTYKFDPATAPLGRSRLTIEAMVYQVDASVSWAALQYNITLVEKESDLPADAVPVTGDNSGTETE